MFVRTLHMLIHYSLEQSHVLGNIIYTLKKCRGLSFLEDHTAGK